MIIKVLMLLVFFTIMVGIGFYCRQTATDVNGFVLGGRSVGPWLTAFAYGTSYFSAVIFVGYAGQFGLRRTVRLEIRYCGNLGRHWKRSDRFPDGLEDPRQTHKDHDPASGHGYHA